MAVVDSHVKEPTFIEPQYTRVKKKSRQAVDRSAASTIEVQKE